MIGAVGNIILMSVGYMTSLLLPPDQDADSKLREMTIWHWLKSRKQSPAGVVEPARSRWQDVPSRRIQL